ncbi:hypothetical protein [Larkinella sp. C7]|jgi:hypothetical protein|uniref:hypothetical protein n=1 Tax=Larkinella sp. C7 TaxID=2576607 RepID=UPI00111105DB|nr:hypothetical protein [Larkinella sp. C7]
MYSQYHDLGDLFDKYNEVVNSANLMAFFTRDINLQKGNIASLLELIEYVEEFKQESIQIENEEKANFLLCLQLYARAIMTELEMLVSLKEDNISEAWDYLVSAQNIVSSTVRNYPFPTDGFCDHLSEYSARFHQYEKLLFPQIWFLSRGSIVNETKCSICEQSYSICDHLKGYAYMGKLCCEITEKVVKLEEISFVENPKDKRCRMTHFSSQGNKYDVLTLRKVS